MFVHITLRGGEVAEVVDAETSYPVEFDVEYVEEGDE